MKSFTTQYNTNENLTIKMEIIQYKIYNINKILYNLDKKNYTTQMKKCKWCKVWHAIKTNAFL